MSLMLSETASSQNFVRNREGEIVGVITEQGDTLHAIPITESRIIHEAAVKHMNLLHQRRVMDSVIQNLMYQIWEIERRYEDLMKNAGDTSAELRKQIQSTKDERNELRRELRKLRRKLFWANVRTGVVVVVGSVVIWLISKD